MSQDIANPGGGLQPQARYTRREIGSLALAAAFGMGGLSREIGADILDENPAPERVSLELRSSDQPDGTVVAELGKLNFEYKMRKLPDGRKIWLGASPSRISRALLADQQEALNRLLEASGNFAAPWDIEMKKKSRGRVSVTVMFLFLGPEDPDRRVRLEVIFRDSIGSVLKLWSRDCEDERIRHRLKPRKMAGIIEPPSGPNTRNFEDFQTTHEVFDKTRTLQVVFQDL